MKHACPHVCLHVCSHLTPLPHGVLSSTPSTPPPVSLQQSLLSSPYIAPREGHCSTGSSLLINCKLNPSSFEFAISG